MYFLQIKSHTNDDSYLGTKEVVRFSFLMLDEMMTSIPITKHTLFGVVWFQEQRGMRWDGSSFFIVFGWKAGGAESSH